MRRITIRMKDEATGMSLSKTGNDPQFYRIFAKVWEGMGLQEDHRHVRDECYSRIMGKGGFFQKSIPVEGRTITIAGRGREYLERLQIYVINGKDVRYDHQWGDDPLYDYAAEYGRAVSVHNDTTVTVYTRKKDGSGVYKSGRQKAIVRTEKPPRVTITMTDEVTGQRASWTADGFDDAFDHFYWAMNLDKYHPTVQEIKEECRHQVEVEKMLYLKTTAFEDDDGNPRILTVTGKAKR